MSRLFSDSNLILVNGRSSRPEVFCKKGVLKKQLFYRTPPDDCFR